MDTIILYVITVVLVAISAARDREKTRRALLKGMRVFESILPQFLAVLVAVAVVLAHTRQVPSVKI